ncbi:MAG: hypothetical protein QXQ46_08885 [Thermoplasmatales archaeon]
MNAVRAVEYVVKSGFNGEAPEGLILRTDINPNISQQFRRAMNILGIKLEYI